MIEVRDLDVRAGGNGRCLLSGLSLDVAAGQVMAVLGPNGRGKTTLLRTLLGLLPAAAGKVRLGGHAAYVPQQGESTFPYPVLSMVAMGRARHLRWWQSPGREDMSVAQACLEAVGLGGLAGRSFHELSGGQKQLVHIARAMASASPIVVLDEPMAALDLRNQDLVLGILARLAREQRLCIVFSTHSPQHALHIADQTLLLYPDACEAGPTQQVCEAGRLGRVYQMPVALGEAQDVSGRPVRGVIPLFQGA